MKKVVKAAAMAKKPAGNQAPKGSVGKAKATAKKSGKY